MKVSCGAPRRFGCRRVPKRGTAAAGRASRLALRPAAIVSRGMKTPDRVALSLAGNPTTA